MSGTIRNALRKLVLIPVILSMMCVYVPENNYEAYAAGDIGSLNGRGYDDFDDLIDDLEDDYSGKAVTIEMLTNWDADVDSDFDERLIIPSNCKATLNMNGWVFDRGNVSGSEFNGELICMESGSNLTINGGPKTRHDEIVYTSTDWDDTTGKTFYGGVLTGAANDNGAGGIHVKSDCTLTINDTTIAGCRAHAPLYDRAGTNSAYGGGIWLTGGDTNLTLNNSTITGCYAYYDGGGIFQSNHNNVSIELKNSHVDSNFAGDEGGGIDVYGEKITIKGKGKSTVNGNQSKNDGGGIYMWNDEVTINNLTIANNKAGGNGGGIYSQEETISMGNLVITDNHADGRGGGIYIYNDGNTISSCTITNNSAGVSGNGVYVDEDVDEGFTVSGTTVIKDNGGSNLYMSDGDWEDSRIQFSLTKGAEVWIRYYDGNHDTIMVTPGKKGDEVKAKDYSQYLYSDQDGYYFAFDSAANMRKIMRYKGEREEKPEPTGVKWSDANNASAKGETSANKTKAGVVRQVGEGGNEGTGYDLIRGFYMHEKFDSATEDNLGVFYYTDGFFYGDNAEYSYNPHLGTASWVLAYACSYLRHDEEEDENGNVYYNKHAGGKQFLADIGCPDQKIYVNDSMQVEPGLDSIGVTIASKELKKNDEATGDILIPVGIRGGGYGAEWASNVTLGSYADTKDIGHEARGFATAADITISEIEYYLKKYGLEDEYKNGNVIFWVSGFSRAGATANLTSKRLVDKIAKDCTGDKKSRVFGYPCEAPKGGTDEAEVEGNNYICIHNMVNKVDVVPYVGPEQMGFKRYGVDHYIPGTDAGTIAEEKYEASRFQASPAGQDKVNWFRYVTTRRDNTYTPTKTAKYDARRTLMLSHLAAIDSDMLFDDYFHPMAMDFIPPHMYEEGDYDNNRAEDFVQDFIRFVQEGFPNQKYYLNKPDQGVDSRQRWAEELQNPMRDTMSLLFSIDAENKEGFVNRASTIANKIKYIGGSDISMKNVYSDVIGNWYKLSETDKQKYISFFWKKLVESGALDYISEQDRSNLEKNWPAIANFIFRMVDGDYNLNTGKYAEAPTGNWSTTYGWAKGVDETMTYLPTFATFSSYILSSHNPEINMAWAMTYDSYYQDGDTNLEPTEYTLKKPDSVAIPEAFVMEETTGSDGTVTEEEKALTKGEDKTNKLRGDQKIILENKDIVGEAVYYDLYDTTGGSEKLEKNKLYQGGIDLSIGDESKKSYRIVTYDMSYGVSSEKAVYNIDLISDKHQVSVYYGGDGQQMLTYSEGDEVSLVAPDSPIGIFSHWTITDSTGEGAGTDVTSRLLKGDANKNETIKFTMPEAGKSADGYTWADDYELTVKAVYRNKVNHITVSGVNPPAAGDPGEDLTESAYITFSNGTDDEIAPVTLPVTWTYVDEDGSTVIDSGEAYGETVYTASINVPKDAETWRIFNETVLTAELEGSDVEVSVTRNASDGSVTLTMTFPETGEGAMKPTETVELIIEKFDINDVELDTDHKTSYKVNPDTSVTLTAPDLSNESFSNWDFGDTGITTEDGYKESDKTVSAAIPELSTDQKTLTIKAVYIPVVSAVAAAIDEPAAGEALPDKASLTVSITNDFEVDPDYVKVEWSPSDARAGYLKEYTATISLAPDEEGNIRVRPAGSDGAYVKYNVSSILYAENVDATVNNKEAGYSTKSRSLSYTFAPIKYSLSGVKPVTNPADMPHGSDADDIAARLPKTTKVITNDGTEFDAEIDWDAPEKVSGEDDLDASVWTVSGKVILPEGKFEDPDKETAKMLNVSVSVNVKKADAVSMPVASVESGTYLPDQYVTLATGTEDADIYYTLDGSDPSTSSTRYEGEEIAIKREDAKDGKITLKAIAAKGGMYNSEVAAYEYVFSDEVNVPEDAVLLYNFKEQTGVSRSDFYTLEAAGDGVKIDDNGNAVATKAGTYTVKAKVAENFRWVVYEYELTRDNRVKEGKEYFKKDGDAYVKVEPEEGDNPTEKGWYEYNRITTEKDQTITFTIKPLSLKDAVVEVVDDPSRLVNGKAEPKVKVTVGGIELPEGAYKVKYISNTRKGTGKVVITGDGENLVDESDPVKFTILPEEFTITYDLNGGTYDGSTDNIIEKHEDGERIRLLGEPAREGYEFDYWKGSKYKAGARYKVKGDHTFVAQWKKTEDTDASDEEDGSGGSGDNDSSRRVKTGDDNSLMVYVTLMLTSLAGLAFVLRIRRKMAKAQRNR